MYRSNYLFPVSRLSLLPVGPRVVWTQDSELECTFRTGASLSKSMYSGDGLYRDTSDTHWPQELIPGLFLSLLGPQRQ